MSRISFAPLEPDAVTFLEDRTGIDYSFCDFASPQWFCCTARDGDRILGVFIGEAVTWFEIQITCAIDHPRFLTRRLLRTIFSTLFSQAVRLTAFVSPDNEQGLNIMRHLNFQYEGFVRLGIEGRRDAMMFGLLRQECRYLREMPPVLSRPDAPDVTSRDTKPSPQSSMCIAGRTNDHDTGRSQLGVGIGPSVLGQVVSPLQGDRNVLAFRLPLKMPGIDAAQMPVVTEVSGLSFGEWRWPVSFFANKTGDEIGASIQPEDGVASLVSGMRPEQAAIVTKADDSLTEKPFRFTVEGPASQRIAMSAPAVPMHPAQTLGNDALGTTVNFASGTHENNNANIDGYGQ